ncbi:hypothetical protein NKH10_27490 [Mesorhizobium sp. M1340]|uniref:hypothetical protein n=1 Tax=unclassified Mesorhizobium TaxID=325217 RepID=UPI00333DC3F1
MEGLRQRAPSKCISVFVDGLWKLDCSEAMGTALLGRVFDRLKSEALSEQRREALASRIIANYMAGLVDEEELLSASRQALGR